VKALVWQGPRSMSVEESPEPEPGPGEVVLRTGAAGICGSEVEGYLGRMGNRTPPLVMGHEFAGTVSKVGEGVDPSWEGRRVAVNPLLPCDECPICRAGMENACPNRTMIGIQHPGAFAEYVRVPAAALLPVPDTLPMTAAALAEPFANGVHAVRLAQVRGPMERAVVLGAGTIGTMVLQAAVLSGIPEVTVVEPHEGRREKAFSFGANAAFPSGEDAKEALREATGGLGADVVFDAAGTSQTRRLAAGLLRPGGMAVLVGLHEDESLIPFHHLVRNQLALQGSYAYTREDFRQALDWISEGRAGIGELPDPLPLSEGPEAFRRLAEGPTDQVKIFLAEGA